jgi:hypothetical protein
MRQNYYKQKQRANVDCKELDETVEESISACTILGKERYIQRHDTLCVELHCNICREMGGKLYSKQLYGHVQKLVS